MCPFPGAIGRFWIHGAEILPSRAAFRVEGSEIMHGAKNLPALLGLFVTRPVVWSNGLCALSPIPGLLDARVRPCNPGRAHRYRYHALPPACDRRTACALPTPHPHPAPPADPATSRPADTSAAGLRSPPIPPPRRALATCAAHAPPPSRPRRVPAAPRPAARAPLQFR